MSGSPAQAGARRELTAAIAATALAGGLALSSAGQPWARLTLVRPLPLPPVSGVVSGGQAAPLVPAMGLLLLAAAVATVALRGAARNGLGALVAGSGGVLVWSAVRVLTGPATVGGGPLASGASAPGTQLRSELTGWPLMAVVAGALALAVGLLVLLRGRRWPAMGRRYERGEPGAAGPAKRPATDEDRASAAWRALDRGEDPTGP